LTSGLIASNPYFNQWNQTIIGNATSTLGDAPVPYTPDGGLGGSGVLDVARKMKVRVKNWAYAYRVTNDTRLPIVYGSKSTPLLETIPMSLSVPTVHDGIPSISSMSPNSVTYLR